jgi:hypothetical protein
MCQATVFVNEKAAYDVVGLEVVACTAKVVIGDGQRCPASGLEAVGRAPRMTFSSSQPRQSCAPLLLAASR